MLEAIIGRQHGTNCLLIIIQGKSYPISDNGTVPTTVSSSHCKLTVDDNGTWKLSNIKAELDTFVDGLQIDTKVVTPHSRVELGANHFVLNMYKVESVIRQVQPAVYSLRPLERVWNEYHRTQLQMQIDEKKKNVNRMLTGVLSPISMILFIFPMMLKTEIPSYVNVIRLLIASAMAFLSLYFFIQSHRGLKNDIILRMDRLNTDFRQRYICPNPQCHHFMGNQPYDVLRQMTRCPYCGCKFKSA